MIFQLRSFQVILSLTEQAVSDSSRWSWPFEQLFVLVPLQVFEGVESQRCLQRPGLRIAKSPFR